jgi:predicted TIM-barrel fold metal-dependent hydrolase
MSRPSLAEPILEPDLPIVDPHHHVWWLPEAMLAGLDAFEDDDGRKIARTYRLHSRYLFEDLLADVTAGHNVRATVFVEAHSMYRADGPPEMRSLGEIEFVNGVAAMSASGQFGDVKLCAGIVGGVDLRLGERVDEVLQAHLRAAGGRYRGVRPPAVCYDEALQSLKHVLGVPGLLGDATFRAGFSRLAPLGLSCDLIIMDAQLPEVRDLARAFPETRIVLDHTGSPVGIGPYAGRREERFAVWRDEMRRLAAHENVVVKVGGLGMALCGFPTSALIERAGSERLAQDWRPYVETAIEIFGVNRCMFESNFPVDGVTASYPVIWNTYKRIVGGASQDEKLALFGGTAAQIYRLEI